MRSILLLSLLMSVYTCPAAANQLDNLIRHNAWLDGGNAAGLCTLDDSLRLNDAQISYQFGRGGLTDYSDPQRSIQWCGEVQSLYRLNASTVMSGEVSYLYRRGYEMEGSAWIDPSDQPFDVVEYTEGCAGRKILEHYHLNGAISHSLGDWSLGVECDYTAANYAKQKDLRHQNRLMKLDLSPGMTYRIGNLRMGLNYRFRRSTEGVSFNRAGTTDRDYITLVTYGAFLGMREQSTTLYDGYTSTSEGDRPMVNQWNELSLQGEYRNQSLSWFNRLTLGHRTGYYGRETSYSIVYEDHEGNQYDWHSQLGLGRMTAGLWSHLIELHAHYQMLNAKERLWNEVNQGGGLTEYAYYDQQQRLDRTCFEVSLGYARRFIQWEIGIGGNYKYQDQTVSYYPQFRNQDISQYSILLEGERRWKRKSHLLELGLKINWQQGNGTMAKDGKYDGANASTRTVSHDRYLLQHYEYCTCRQGGIALQVRYATPQGLYTRLHHQLTHTFEGTAFVNPSYNTLNVSLGFEF